MKRKVLIITNLILAVMLALFAVGYTYAWFAEYYKTDIKLYADHDQAYFASGDGKSESTAYEINSYRHLYNLAWLQNTGKISDGTYFKISANISMLQGGTYFVIPPIGNDKYPFNSTIDGGGCTISSLIVSTDKNKLTNFPNEKASSYAFSNYVGLFGSTGTSSSISNFILDNPIVEVADDSTGSTANTLYSTSGSESCVGLAIGYVNGSASSIGVIGGILAVQKTGYVTYNSILGSYDKENITSSVTGEETGDVGTGILSAKIFINKVSATTYEFGTYSSNVFTFSENIWLVSADSDAGLYTDNYFGMGVFSILTGSSSSLLTINKSEEDSIAITFTDEGTTTDTYTVKFLNTYLSSSSSSTIWTERYDYYFDDNSTLEEQTGVSASDFNDKVNDDSVYNIDTNYYWTFSGSYDTSKSGIKVIGEDHGDLTSGNKQIDNFNNSDTNKSLYKQTIKFNVVDVTGNPYIYIVASNNRTGDGDKESGICITKTSEVPTTTDGKFYFRRDYKSVDDGAAPKEDYNYKIILPGATKGVTDYIGVAIPITEKGLYTISPASSADFNLYYLAVDGVQNGDDGSSGSESKVISNVDFIYSDVILVEGEFVLETDTTKAYTETNTMIYLSTSASTTTTAVLIIAYTRSSDYEGYYESTNEHTIHIDCYGTDTPTGSTDSLVDKTSVSSEDLTSVFSSYYAVDTYYSSSS